MKRLLAIALLACAGCCNLMMRPDAEQNLGPYWCTCEVAETLAVPFSEPKGPEGGFAKAYCTLLFPVILIDFPFDAAVDTVMLPWDLCRHTWGLW